MSVRLPASQPAAPRRLPDSTAGGSAARCHVDLAAGTSGVCHACVTIHPLFHAGSPRARPTSRPCTSTCWRRPCTTSPSWTSCWRPLAKSTWLPRVHLGPTNTTTTNPRVMSMWTVSAATRAVPNVMPHRQGTMNMGYRAPECSRACRTALSQGRAIRPAQKQTQAAHACAQCNTQAHQ